MPLIGGSLGFAFAFVLNLATMRRANLSIRDCFTIGMETGVQNAQIAITIVTMLYAGKNMYAFSQQFFFPVLCFVFQVCWSFQLLIFDVSSLPIGSFPWWFWSSTSFPKVKQFYLKTTNIPTKMANPSQVHKPIRRLSCQMTCKIK